MTKEAFLICARKDANPSLTIPLTVRGIRRMAVAVPTAIERPRILTTARCMLAIKACKARTPCFLDENPRRFGMKMYTCVQPRPLGRSLMV